MDHERGGVVLKLVPLKELRKEDIIAPVSRTRIEARHGLETSDHSDFLHLSIAAINAPKRFLRLQPMEGPTTSQRYQMNIPDSYKFWVRQDVPAGLSKSQERVDVSMSTRSIPVSGIPNIGQSCFVGSTVQCLLNCDAFVAAAQGIPTKDRR